MIARFIGGSANGVEINMPGPFPNIRIPVPAELTLDLPLDPEIPDCDYEDYELQTCLGAGGAWLYFAIDREEGE